MTDLGPPTSYLGIREGVPVLCSDGRELGELMHVLGDADKDIFDGLVVDADRPRFVDARHVQDFFERGVQLSLSYEEAERQPEPTANPAAMGTEPADAAEGELTRKLRNAWDRISGRY